MYRAILLNPVRNLNSPMVPGSVWRMCDQEIEKRVEALCRKGCGSVRENIRLLEQGGFVPELKGLEGSARHAVLQELRSIIAVYGERCPINEIKNDKRRYG